MSRARLISLVLCIASVWLMLPSAAAFEDLSDIPNARDKAMYILKFHRFVTWPQEKLAAGAPITIGVVGAEKIAQELAMQSALRPPDKRMINVVPLKPGDSLEGIHTLFIGNDQLQRQPNAWLEEAKGKPILCITDSGDAMLPGSMINLVQDNERIRFDVSLTAAEHGRIELSAGLLTVAREVYGGKK